MKNLPKNWGGLLLVVLFGIGNSIAVSGQPLFKHRKSEIQFFDPVEATTKELLIQSGFANRKFWILMRTKSLTKSEIQSWMVKGISITNFRSPEIMEVSAPANLSPVDFKKLGVEKISMVFSDHKLDPHLKIRQNECEKLAKIKVQVISHKGLKSSHIKSKWKAAWGQIEECWLGDFGKWIITCTPDQIDSLAGCGWSRWIELADEALMPLNQVAAANGRVRTINSAGFGWQQGLNGEGISVAIGDGGMVDLHSDMEKNQENWTGSKLAAFSDHQDHVSGILGGQGLLQTDKMGMATGARMVNLQTSSVISMGEHLVQNEGISLTNNSYGQPLQCSRSGLYNATSSFMDEQIYANPTLLHIVASGNQGGSACNGYPIGFQTIAEGYPVSKNGLTVGAVLGKDEFAWFSSMGPVADGRLKPELVADGNDVFSTVPQDQYASKGGTSMAAPVVTGTLALLSQRYKQLNNNQLPEAALLKAIVCNSAEDIGRPKVDFSSGFGRLNGRRARQLIESHSFISGIALSGQTQIHNFTAPSGAIGVKVMLSWSDPSGIPGEPKALVNNLNLKVRNAAGQTHLPWILDPSPGQVNQPAFRGVDSLNTLEQVTLQVFGGESIQIEVSSPNLTSGEQKYWLVYQWDVPSIWLTSPYQNEWLKSGQSTTFYWDLDATEPTQFVIQNSPDSTGPWTDLLVVSNPKKLSIDQLIPEANFQNIWFRIRAETDFGPLFSNSVGCKIGKTVLPQFQMCNSTVRISWNGLSEATRYEILRLEAAKGTWRSLGSTTETQFTVGKLENGVRVAFSVTPWFGNQAGIRSAAKVVVPTEAGNCNLQDLAITGFDMPTFFRKGTSQSSDLPVPIRLIFKNVGNETINRSEVLVRVKMASGQTTQSVHSLVLMAGESKWIELPQSLDVSQVGDFPLTLFMVGSLDSNPCNDTLSTIVRVVDNPNVALPWKFDGLTMPEANYSKSFLGVLADSKIDFSSVNQARLRTTSRNLPQSFGNYSLVLDKNRIDGKTASSELIFTLNLAGNVVDNELFIDFDIFPYSTLSSGNEVWIRTDDHSPWSEILSLSGSNFPVGEVAQVRSLNIKSFLSSTILTSSFQIKFTYSGQKPSDILNGGGYAVDNLMLYIPSRDVVIRSILSPSSGCAGPASQKVKIRLFNERETSAQQVKIGYSFGSGEVFEQIIPVIEANDSLEVDFATLLPSNLLGKINLKVWSIAEGDQYFLNDTLQPGSIFIAPIITKFPYYQGFEESNGFWHSFGEKSSWEWGKPSKSLSVIDTAANGIKLWTTNLDGFYNANESSFLQSPCFNVASLQGDIQFSFNSKYDTEPDYDNIWVEYSEDGKTWKKLGGKGSGTNWYNHDSQNWNGNQTRWHVVSCKLSKALLSNQKMLQFRLGFQADLSNQREGIAFDDFHLEPSIEIGNEFIESVSLSRQTRGNHWTRIGSEAGRLAEIETSNQTGTITFSSFGNSGKIRQFGYSSYLDRNFKLESGDENDLESKIRFFFTESDLKKLEQIQPELRSFQNLAIYQYRGLNMDGVPENNAFPIGKSRFIPSELILKVPTSGGYYVEFLAVPDGEFYLTTQSFDSGDLPLPVHLIQFSANRKLNSKAVEIYWKTASERNCESFELQYSVNGSDYEEVGSFKPKGSENLGFEYVFTHKPPNAGQTIWYRLNQYDFQNSTPHSYFTVVRNEPSSKAEFSFVNPVDYRLELVGKAPANGHILVSDAFGRIVVDSKFWSPESFISTGGWAQGAYFLKVISEEGIFYQTLLKN